MILPTVQLLQLQGIDRSTRIWDVRTGQCEMKFENQETEVNAVKFFPSGEAVAAAGNDGIVSEGRRRVAGKTMWEWEGWGEREELGVW